MDSEFVDLAKETRSSFLRTNLDFLTPFFFTKFAQKVSSIIKKLRRQVLVIHASVNPIELDSTKTGILIMLVCL